MENLQNLLKSQESEISKLKKDQEDLLVCLEDQDANVKKYRERLIALNQEVTDIEDDDEEEEEYDE